MSQSSITSEDRKEIERMVCAFQQRHPDWTIKSVVESFQYAWSHVGLSSTRIADGSACIEEILKS